VPGLLLCASPLSGRADETDRPNPKPAVVIVDDHPLLRGVWACTAAEKDGEKLPDELIRGMKFILSEKVLRMELLGQAREGTWKIGRSKGRKTIDLTLDNMTVLGIYTLEGTTLTICAREPGENRPEEFNAAPNSRRMLVIFRRVSGGGAPTAPGK
jgi:uncharacterized protein (TIGR03067 family)